MRDAETARQVTVTRNSLPTTSVGGELRTGLPLTDWREAEVFGVMAVDVARDVLVVEIGTTGGTSDEGEPPTPGENPDIRELALLGTATHADHLRRSKKPDLPDLEYVLLDCSTAHREPLNPVLVRV